MKNWIRKVLFTISADAKAYLRIIACFARPFSYLSTQKNHFKIKFSILFCIFKIALVSESALEPMIFFHFLLQPYKKCELWLCSRLKALAILRKTFHDHLISHPCQPSNFGHKTHQAFVSESKNHTSKNCTTNIQICGCMAS